MNLHGGYIKRAKTAKKWQRKNGSGVQWTPPPGARGLNTFLNPNQKRFLEN